MLAELLRRVRYGLSGNRRRAELEEEMRLHVALRAERLESEGMSRSQAECEARRRFGNPLQLHEQSRERWVGRRLDEFGRDIRIGCRSLRRDAAFTVVVLVTLALGTGANGAIFRLYDVLGLRPLPVEEPEQLSLIQLADEKGWRGSQYLSWPALTNLQWEYLRDHQRVFDGVLAWSPNGFGYGEDPKLVHGLFVSGGFFEVLGVRAVAGRVFTADVDRRGCGAPGAVISHAFWQREMAGDPDVLGHSILLNAVPVPVIGVTEASFTGPEIGTTFDVAVPICSQAALWNGADWLDEGAVWWLTVMGRNSRGRSQAALDEGLRVLSPELFGATLTPSYPQENAADYLKMRLKATPAAGGVSQLRDRYATSLGLLLVATALVLLLMSANLGNMVLARASARTHEFGLRVSIGASRASLIRQLLVENAMLALAGSAAGFVVAGVLSRFLLDFLTTADGAPFLDLRPTGGWLEYSLAVAVACVVVFGLVPAWQVSRADPGEALRGVDRVTPSGSAAALRKVLVVTQVAVSLVLVFGALLFGRTLVNVLSVDAGFDRAGVLTSWIDYSRLSLPPEQRQAFRRELLERIRANAGVAAAGETNLIPLSGSSGSSAIWVEGVGPGQAIGANTQFVGAGYLEALGIPVLSGRDFDGRDVVGSPRVAIINQSLARRLGLGANPVGKRFRKEANPWDPEMSYEVIGVIRDTRYASLKDGFEPTAFYAIAQDAEPGPFVQHVIRSKGDASRLAAGLRAMLKADYPAIGVNFRELETTVVDGLLRERLLATVCGFLGGLAALIAAIGLYGVITYLVSKRANEIGIRMALGATAGHVVGTVASQTLALAGVGIAIGIIAAMLAGQATRALVFGVAPSDPATLTLAVLLLVGVAAAAAFLPARRAARLDPLTALRRG